MLKLNRSLTLFAFVCALFLLLHGTARADSIVDPTPNQGLFTTGDNAQWFVPCDFEWGAVASTGYTCGGYFETNSNTDGTLLSQNLTGTQVGTLSIASVPQADFAYQEVDQYDPATGNVGNPVDYVVFNNAACFGSNCFGPVTFSFNSNNGSPFSVAGFETNIYSWAGFTANVSAYDAQGNLLGGLSFNSTENDQELDLSSSNPTYGGFVGIYDANAANIASVVVSTTPSPDSGGVPGAFAIGYTEVQPIEQTTPEPRTFFLIGFTLISMLVWRCSKRYLRVLPFGAALLFLPGIVGAQTISISPSNPQVNVGGTIQFTATASGLAPGVTVEWFSDGIQGGDSTYGFISANGLYTAPATVPANGQAPILAYASDNSAAKKTYVTVLPAGQTPSGSSGSGSGSSAPPSGPVISSITPNPIPVGTDTLTISGSGFQQGALVYETYGSQNMIQYAASSVSANAITVTIYQGAGTTASFEVRNPNGVYSAAMSVPIGGSGGGTASGAPTLISVNPNPLPVGTDTVTLQGSGFSSNSLVYDSYGNQSMIQYAPISVSSGTITVSIYQGAASSSSFCVKNPGTACSNSISVPVTAASSGGTTGGSPTGGGTSGGGSNNVPTLTSVTPNPIPVGTQQITIQGNGFLSGALAYVSYGSQVGIQYAPDSVSANTILVTIYQASAASTSVCVKNPGSACSNSITVPVNSGPPPAPTIFPATVNVNLGATQQFTGTNTTSFSATAGTITSGGFYTAPTVMPVLSTVTITATGPSGTATATVTLINPNPQIVLPAAVTLSPGATQQFTSQGATSWAAVSGTITANGFYTAPASWVAAQDTIQVTGPNGNANAIVTLTPPTPVVLSVGNNNQLPLGVFSAQVSGNGFTALSTVTLGGNAVNAVYSNGSLTISGFDGQAGTTPLVVTNGNVSSQPFAVVVGVANPMVSASAARRFLQQAGFGPSPADAANVQALGFQGWLNQQFAMPVVSNYSAVSGATGMPAVFLTNAVSNSDQLRQKVAFALSQIFVTSLTKVGSNSVMIPYQQMLLNDSFTNFLQILTDVTLSPCMGYYLDMANNAQANPSLGTAANENYAREVMQLMSIGTKVLNPDGTWPVDGNGLPIATYSQADVTAMARIFTGWTFAPATPGGLINWGGPINPAAPMVAYLPEHDISAKTVMSYSAQQGLSPLADLTGILAYLASHPNTAPFISKQLIEHLVKSNPSPQYVQRVATAFTNSSGDMPTVISAILLDAEARANDEGGNDQATDGHLQEPVLLIAGVVRALGGQMTPANFYPSTLQSMGQDIFSAPSVFNYYGPNYVIAGSGGLLGPEFQIDNPNAAILRENFIAGLTESFSNPVLSNGPGTTIDVTPFLPMAANPAMLMNAIDLTLTGGVMPAQLKTIIQNAVAGEKSVGALYQVETAIYLTVVSSYYNVWH